MKRAIFILWISLSQFVLHAQDSLQVIGSTDGAACFSICAHGDYLYTGNGNTISVFEAVGNPPYNETFRFKYSSNIDDIQVWNNRLYVCANHAGLFSYDLTDPSQPALLASFKPDSLSEAAWDVSFYGTDTLFVTYKTKCAVFRDLGNNFQLLTTFGHHPDGAVRGGGIKDSLFVYVLGFSGADDGVYIVDARDLNQYSFYHQPYCEPEEVLFGSSDSTVHVLGGTASWTNFLDPKGIFYSLDISDPTNPVEIFRDTLNTVWGLGIASPMNGINKDDTLFFATNAAFKPGFNPLLDPAEGHIYVYSVSDKDTIHRVTTLYGGLWHFDVDIQHDTIMHVASEWFGVESTNIKDLMNPVFMGKSLTGGWNWGSTTYDSVMIVCNGGYGFKVFDITDPENPSFVLRNTDGFFAKTAEFSEDGQYLYVFYNDGDSIRVFETTNYTLLKSYKVGALLESMGEMRIYVHDTILVSQQVNAGKKLNFYSISDPDDPYLIERFTHGAHDYTVNDEGEMFLVKNDSLLIWNLNNYRQVKAGFQSGFLKNFKALAVHRDTIYVFETGNSLIRFIYNGTDSIWEDTRVTLPLGEPKYMAADSFGLYLCYVEEGLFSYNKQTLTEVDWFEHSLEFVVPNQWGPRDLFCDNGMIFLVEWYGQTTILSHKNGAFQSPWNIVTGEEEKSGQPEVTVYPNPANDYLIIKSGSTDRLDNITILDSKGVKVTDLKRLNSRVKVVPTSGLTSGTYIIRTQLESGKLIGNRVVIIR